jgi:hypothetical protein
MNKESSTRRRFFIGPAMAVSSASLDSLAKAADERAAQTHAVLRLLRGEDLETPAR